MRFRNRHGLARNHRLIDKGSAIGHRPVDRDFFARTDHDDIANHDLIECNFSRLAIAQHTGRFRLQSDQPLYGVAGPSLGARFEQAADKNERNNDRCRFEIDVARGFGQKLRGKGDNARIEVCGTRTQRHERIHVRRAPEKRGYTLDEKAAARTEQHGAGQHEIGQIEPIGRHDAHQPVVKRLIEVAAHFQHEQWQGQDRGDDDVALECADFVGLCLFAGLRLSVRQTMGCVSGGSYGRFHLRKTGRSTHNVERCLFRSQIDRSGNDTRCCSQGVFDSFDAGRARHAFDADLQSCNLQVVPGILDRRAQGSGVEIGRWTDCQCFVGKVGVRLGNTWQSGGSRLHAGDAGRAAHAFDWKCQRGRLAGNGSVHGLSLIM